MNRAYISFLKIVLTSGGYILQTFDNFLSCTREVGIKITLVSKPPDSNINLEDNFGPTRIVILLYVQEYSIKSTKTFKRQIVS